MPPDETYLTVREFDGHLNDFRALEQRVAWLDEHGTRGVDSLRTAMLAVKDDVSELKTDLAKHEGQHELATQLASTEKTAAHRFRVNATIAASAAVLGILGALFDLLLHAHH
jgi:hypothetical protein